MKKILLSIALILFSISNVYAGSVCQQIRSGQDCGAGNSVMAGLNCAPNADPGDPNSSSVASWDAYCLSLDHGDTASGVYCPSTNFNDSWNTPASCTCDTGWSYNSGTHDCDTCASGYISLGGDCVNFTAVYEIQDTFTASVDCDTGGNIQDTLDSLPYIIGNGTINISGTCNEDNITVSKGCSGELSRLVLQCDTNILLAEQTADSGTRTTLTDTGAFTGTNYAHKFVRLLAGPNYIDPAVYGTQSNNDFAIKSNTDDVLTFGMQFPDVLSAATHYQIIEPAATIHGDDSLTSNGLINYSDPCLIVHVRNCNIDDSWNGLNNYGYMWPAANSITAGTNAYSGILNNVGGMMYTDGNYIEGNWTNASIGNQPNSYGTHRKNYLYNGVEGVEADSSYAYLYGNQIDTMLRGVTAVNSGVITSPSSQYVGNEINNCSQHAFYAVWGGKIEMPLAVGTGNNALGRTIATSDIYYDSSKITAANPDTFDDAGGRIIDNSTNDLYISADTINWSPVNDANPQRRLGASDLALPMTKNCISKQFMMLEHKALITFILLLNQNLPMQIKANGH